jgi:hypothetical protein
VKKIAQRSYDTFLLGVRIKFEKTVSVHDFCLF